MNLRTILILTSGVLALAGCSGQRDLTLSPEKATSRPYKIKGLWYYPQAHYEYSETGIASWYGPGFHGKKTATGEIFDQNLPSAAHKTVPLPSVVVVTNLENGRMLKVKVNDRGPFVSGRIIDLSKRAAELLGFYQAGTAKVKVETLVPESIALASLAAMRSPVTEIKVAQVQRGDVERKSLMTPGGGQPSEQQRKSSSIAAVKFAKNSPGGVDVPMELSSLASSQVAQLPHNIFIQLGAFGHPTDAYKLQMKLRQFGSTRVLKTHVGPRALYKVDIGPFENVGKADAALDRLIAAGYKESKIVIE